MESFKPIPGHPGYEVSDHGTVRSLTRQIALKTKGGTVYTRTSQGRILKPARVGYLGQGNTEYRKVSLGKDCQRRVHALVMLAFVGPANGLLINHIDGDGTNNHLSNLEYCTPKQNMEHAVRTGLTSPPPGAGKLTEDIVRAIKNRLLQGEVGSRIAADYNVSGELISSIKLSKCWAWVN